MDTTPKSGVTTPVLTRVSSTSEFISPSTTRRKHIPLTSTSSMLTDVPEQDNAALRRQRRQSRVLELQKQLQSPGTPTERRQSLSLSNLNNAQITEHYTNCIKLSAENKINSKNAFGLHLIEFMADLLQSKKGEMTNFQVASCTLDASTKIYAGRVDAIHSDTYKMLGGLGHGDKQSNDGGEIMDGEMEVKSKTKKRLRHSNTVETSLKNINVNKFDLGFEVDPLFEKTSASFDEGGTFGLLLNHLWSQDDSCELLLDSNIVLNEKSPSEDTSISQIDLTEIEDMYAGKMLDNLQICNHFADFEFSVWERTEMDQFKDSMQQMKANSEQAFDMAAVPEPLDMEDQFDGPGDLGVGDCSDGEDACGGFDGDSSVFMADGQEARVVSGSSSCRSTSATAVQLSMQLSLQPTEYSYFDMAAMDTWAGPRHWKLKAKCQEEKKAKSKRPVFKIDYSQVQDFDENFKETKAATTLSKATLNKYSNNINVLPEDIHFNPDELFRLFNKPAFTIKRILRSNNEVLVDDDIGSYDYENENDCANFCPAAADDDNDDYESCGFNGLSDQTSISSNVSSFSNVSMFDVTTACQGDKLVAQPHKVNKIDIQYAKTAKRMDVKRLKTLMWNHLTNPPEENKENQDVTNAGDKGGVAGTQSFVGLYDVLPEKLSATMSNNLSIPIAFVCLLHLANEKCLKIVTATEDEDLLITQDS